MARSSFPLFQSHLDLAHSYWKQIVMPGDHVIDATCGNGKDTLILCGYALQDGLGKVYALDMQDLAIASASELLQKHLPVTMRNQVEFYQQCHSSFPSSILPQSVKLIVYNLGYLPKGCKEITTKSESTLQSVQEAENLIMPGGVISITCYPGHAEGAKEQSELLSYASNLRPEMWSCCHHVLVNRTFAPSLLLMQKTNHSSVTENKMIHTINS